MDYFKTGMISVKKLSKVAHAVCMMGASLVISNYVFASGIKVGLESTSDLGNQFAGGAALADDASTNWYNAAGITRIRNDQLVGSLIGVYSASTFSGTSTATSFFNVLLPPLGTNFSQNGNVSSHNTGFVPALHYSMPLSSRTSFGFSVTAPYGLAVKYGEHSLLRFASTQANADSINFGPSIAYKITDSISVGGGPDLMRFKLYARNKNNFNTVIPGLSTEAISENNARGFGYGAHIGALYEYSPCTRVGLSYRSQVRQNLTGNSIFKTPIPLPGLAQFTETNNLQVKLTLPPVYMLSAYTAWNSTWAFMGTLDYTSWSAFNNITTNNAATPAGVTNATILENFTDTLHGAVAANYRASEKYLFRFGVGVDQTASRTRDRSTVSPALGYFAANVGMRYQPTQRIAYDLAYSHAFMNTESINSSNATTLTAQNGTMRGSGDVFGVQAVWNLT